VRVRTQHGVELGFEHAGLSLAHTFQPAAHVKAVSANDDCICLGHDFAILGDSHTLALEGPADKVGQLYTWSLKACVLLSLCLLLDCWR